ncbi:MAG: DUF2505 family protein [Myxococcales bacterium]|nr:DUF2505 family protein [Myxococcales bacterium]
MKFEITHTFDADVETVLTAMYDPALHEFLTKEMTTINEIEQLEKNDEGSRVVRRVRYMPKPLIQKIGPKEIPPRWMEWVEESTLDRGAKTVTFQNRPTTQKIANLLVNQGTMQFRSKGAKTERVLKGELKVKVFLLGKIAEKFIYNQASRILEEEARALNKFIQSRSA